MYQSHFHLHSRPFASAPNPEHYYPGVSVERARESLVLSVERSSGAAIVVGAVGVGKTLLCQLVANQFAEEMPVCMLHAARLRDREGMLQSVLHQLGLPFRNQSEGELRITLTDHVTGQTCPKGILLIVDEADRLKMELLEELRVITNLVKDGEPRVRLVMAGDTRLEERVGHPRMESLNQRIVCRLYLEQFSPEETSDYIRARITASGGNATDLYTEEALDTVYRATSGVPRLVNQLCDHVLILGALNGLDQIDKHSIEEAWADLQQLPIPESVQNSPRAGYGNEATLDGVVEIGALDDELEESAAEGMAVDGMAPHIDFAGEVEIEVGAITPDQTLDQIEQSVRALHQEGQASTDAVSALLAPLDGEPEAVITGFALQDSAEVDSDLGATEEEVLNDKFVIEINDNASLVQQTESEHASQEIVLQDVADEDGASAGFKIELQESAAYTEEVLEFDDQEASTAEDDPSLHADFTEPEGELTIANAANPFDELFDSEEVVIQQFAAPSTIARRDLGGVTSPYSRGLAARLTAARPGLRMHVEQDAAEDPDESADEYQPLSAFWGPNGDSDNLDDQQDSDTPLQDGEAGDAEAEGESEEIIIQFEQNQFDPISDPVLPEPVPAALIPEVAVAAGGQVVYAPTSPNPTVMTQVASIETYPVVDVESEVALEEVAAEATETEVAKPEPEKSAPKVFRRLFTSLRGK